MTVKGLVERDVKSDEAVWTLNVRRTTDDLRQGQEAVAADRDAVMAFLRRQGFKDSEISRDPSRTIDRLAREFGGDARPQFRYVITTAVVVRTSNVDLVRSSLGSTESLLKAGVVLDGEQQGPANPRYVVSRFNDLRPQLLAEATKNARVVAEQFAADSGARVGKIHSASQGTIQIFGTDGNDESGPYGQTSTINKRIRLVSTLEFELN